MRIKSAVFKSSADRVGACPRWNLPEIALIGRSNVGKSSLVNLLANQRSLAKVSSTPGKTRLLNFFEMNGQWSLVDLPGYGYAKASHDGRYGFSQLVADYIEQRENLRRVLVLIDSRHDPQRIDLEFLTWLNATGAPFSLVFTKVDKQSVARTRANIALFQEHVHPLLGHLPDHCMSSTLQNEGRHEVLAMISAALAADDRERDG